MLINNINESVQLKQTADGPVQGWLKPNFELFLHVPHLIIAGEVIPVGQIMMALLPVSEAWARYSKLPQPAFYLPKLS